MFPAEFLARYGQSVEHYDAIPLGQSLTIAPNVDRYLLVFWTATGSPIITPGSGEPPDTNVLLGTPTPLPQFITHTLHGTLANAGWRVNAVMGDAVIVWIEAFMRGVKSVEPSVGAPTGISLNVPRSVTANIPATEATPLENVIPPSNTAQLRPAIAAGAIPGIPRGLTMAEVRQISQMIRPEPDPLIPIHYLQVISDEVVAAYHAQGIYVWYSVNTSWYYIEVP